MEEGAPSQSRKSNRSNRHGEWRVKMTLLALHHWPKESECRFLRPDVNLEARKGECTFTVTGFLVSACPPLAVTN